MARDNMNFKSNISSNPFTPRSLLGSGLNPTGQMNPYEEHPNLLYNMYKKTPNFLQNMQQNVQDDIDSLRQSAEGMPKSLYDLFINKKMGFNLGDKGYLNLQLPESQGKFDRGESGFGLNLRYDF